MSKLRHEATPTTASPVLVAEGYRSIGQHSAMEIRESP